MDFVADGVDGGAAAELAGGAALELSAEPDDPALPPADTWPSVSVSGFFGTGPSLGNSSGTGGAEVAGSLTSGNAAGASASDV